MLLDLDGTLLDERDRISPRTVAAVRAAAKLVPVAIASGRVLEDVTHFARLLGLDGPQICDNGARLVTFDVRLSNTAGRSDEWFAPFPGTEGAVALGMAHAIMKAGQFDRDFLTNWTNLSIEKLIEFLGPYTPAWAAKVSGLSAEDIERVALEFAMCRPRCAA